MRALLFFPALLLAAGCVRSGDAAEAREPDIVRRAMQQVQQQPAANAGQPTFIQHPEHIQPGLSLRGGFATLTNPFQGDAARIKEGGVLFVSYNCMDCHGADGSGAMGPSLADGRFHFGGTAGEVFQSIYEGRPDGMPAWGGRIPDDQIWRLVAYVQSLGANKDVATENFTGKTIQKMGH
ncbi:MAG TPA: c-type cytochrome [Gemmatimonadaceae bacterium]|nr:c-type cytochrome [Gemmatimonadaceae bacterium]